MAIGIVAMSMAIIYYVIDPMTCEWMPQCIFYRLTGFKCPGCGLQRAIHAVLHGNLSDAVIHNLFLPVSLPYLFAVCWSSIAVLPLSSTVKRIAFNRNAVRIYILMFFSWWIIRNLLGI